MLLKNSWPLGSLWRRRLFAPVRLRVSIPARLYFIIASAVLGLFKIQRRQRYITDEEVPDPSVITLNALSASQATNDFLLIMTGLLQPTASAEYIQMHPCERVTERVNVRSEPTCRTCSGSSGSRYAHGDRARLPCRQ